jgi:hypothetical protein
METHAKIQALQIRVAGNDSAGVVPESEIRFGVRIVTEDKEAFTQRERGA